MALKQLKKIAEKKNYPVDKLMHLFSNTVDQEILEHKLRPLLSEQYKLCITRDHKYLPENILSHVTKFEDAPGYQRLVGALAEWLTLMEMCEDLVQRLQHYGIT